MASDHHLSPVDSARFFAQVYVTIADAQMTTWNSKYFYNLWRPVTAIRNAGAGKSTAARQLRRMIDPRVAELRAEPRTIDDIMIAASRSRVVALDNLSHLAP